MPITTILLKRSKFSIMITEIKENFWKLEDIHIQESDKEYFLTHYKRMKIILYAVTVLLVNLFVFHGLAFKAQKIIYPIYKPSWMSINEILILETFVPIFTQDLPMLAIVNLSMSFIVLAQLQFKMLSKEIQFHLMTMKKETSNQIIKKIVDHHNYLLRYIICSGLLYFSYIKRIDWPLAASSPNFSSFSLF